MSLVTLWLVGSSFAVAVDEAFGMDSVVVELEMEFVDVAVSDGVSSALSCSAS